jgi:hypothetical protein
MDVAKVVQRLLRDAEALAHSNPSTGRTYEIGERHQRSRAAGPAACAFLPLAPGKMVGRAENATRFLVRSPLITHKQSSVREGKDTPASPNTY